jgi:hypothetical protein
MERCFTEFLVLGIVESGFGTWEYPELKNTEYQKVHCYKGRRRILFASITRHRIHRTVFCSVAGQSNIRNS